jgi:hypothetical protein
MCAQPTIILADSRAGKGASDPSLRVLLPEGTPESRFSVGKRVEVRGIVHGGKAHVELIAN